LRKAKLLQVVKGTKSEIDNLYIELHHPTRKCNLSNKLCSVNVIVICVGENRSVGEALGLRKGSKIFEYTTISEAVMSLPRSLYWQSRLQSVHKSRILSLVSRREFGLWADEQLSGATDRWGKLVQLVQLGLSATLLPTSHSMIRHDLSQSVKGWHN